MVEIGIDIIAIARIEIFIRKFGSRGLSRFLTPQEMQLAKTSQTIAGFWAAKEACAKALKCGISEQLRFKDILISKNSKGAPLLSLTQERFRFFNLNSLSLSITHDSGFCIAVVAANFKE